MKCKKCGSKLKEFDYEYCKKCNPLRNNKIGETK
tara:strand:- start:474 stop:575 length:102 start_codon:yes stop_codon:yes gene_type:complete